MTDSVRINVDDDVVSDRPGEEGPIAQAVAKAREAGAVAVDVTVDGDSIVARPVCSKATSGPVMVALTFDDPTVESTLEEFNVVGLPTVVVYDSTGTEAMRYTDFVGPEQFLSSLRKVN